MTDEEPWPLTDEVSLRKRIQELQEYRRMGITTLAEAEKYEKDKVARVSSIQDEIGLVLILLRRPREFESYLQFTPKNPVGDTGLVRTNSPHRFVSPGYLERNVH